MSLPVNSYVLIILLSLAVYYDIKEKRIPNTLTFTVIVWGLGSYIITRGFDGFIFSILGLLVGIAIFLIPFILGGMGGGDVKFLGAIGALMGVEFVAKAALFTIFCGGIMAVISLLYRRQLLSTLRKIPGVFYNFFSLLLFIVYHRKLILDEKKSLYDFQPGEEKPAYLPYGVAIAAGTLIVLSNLSEKILYYLKVMQ